MIDHVAYLVLAHAASATRTPDDALSVLNVLPAARSPLTFAAVLSRGFNELHSAKAVEHGLAHILLPHYPHHILYANLDEIFETVIKQGDLPTLQLLWKLAGPDSYGCPLWMQSPMYRILDLALGAGHVHIVEWLDEVTKVVNLELGWLQVGWEWFAAKNRHGMLDWCLERRYLPALTPSIVLATAKDGDTLYISNCLARQLDKASAVAAIKRAWNYPTFLQKALIATLKWWWTHIAQETELPDPPMFAGIINECFCETDRGTVR